MASRSPALVLHPRSHRDSASRFEHVKRDELGCLKADAISEAGMLPPDDGGEMIGMQTDGTSGRCCAAVDVDEMLGDALTQIVTYTHVRHVASILAAVHRVDRGHVRQLADLRQR